MLSARHRNIADNVLMSPMKPKIIKRRLPIDFFEHSASLEIRRSL